MHLGKYGKKMFDTGFYKDKKVLITGHTGFVGSWMSYILLGFGANVSGYALDPEDEPNLFSICGLSNKMNSKIGDIRDYAKLEQTITETKPNIIFHLAAQPIVLNSYIDPYTTYETNVMGTINLLECIRNLKQPPLSVVNITTDKVYKNSEAAVGFLEDDPLDGYDPYSNSKSCAELVTHSYKKCFLDIIEIAVSTARAGNIIGGGDFAKDRILPDCVLAAQKREDVTVRNPFSFRPYQHVLESVFAYLLIAEKQYGHMEFADYYNIGPDEQDCQSTGEIVSMFCKHWGDGIKWKAKTEIPTMHEATYLRLNSSKIKQSLAWRPVWDVDTAIAKTVEWYKTFYMNGNVLGVMDKQISEFLE